MEYGILSLQSLTAMFGGNGLQHRESHQCRSRGQTSSLPTEYGQKSGKVSMKTRVVIVLSKLILCHHGIAEILLEATLNPNHEASSISPAVKSFTSFTGVYIAQLLINLIIPIHISIPSTRFPMSGFKQK